jgi:hypothetical protein
VTRGAVRARLKRPRCACAARPDAFCPLPPRSATRYRRQEKDPRVGPAVQSRGSVSDLDPALDRSAGSTRYLPPSALQLGVSRDGRPMARKASGVMPSVWVTLSTRPTILFDRVPSAFAVTSLMKTEPVA